MKTTALLFIILCLCVPRLKAQVNDSTVKTMAEQMPEFPGGQDSLMKFIRTNLQYPAPARERKMDAKVNASFLVNKDGHISNIVIDKSTDWSLGFNEEVIRVLRLMPAWKPGKLNGSPIDVRMNIPVQFKLSEHPAQITAPEFVGGPEVLTAFIVHEVRYPKKALQDKIEGSVTIKAVIDIRGNVKSAIVEKSLRKDCDKEALHVVEQLTGFRPAISKGVPVEGICTIVVPFTLPK